VKPAINIKHDILAIPPSFVTFMFTPFLKSVLASPEQIFPTSSGNLRATLSR
jgi:hypothetical protein